MLSYLCRARISSTGRFFGRIPWYLMAAACMVGQLTCWLSLFVFFGEGNTNVDVSASSISTDDVIERAELVVSVDATCE
jgi:hypothetical protein